MGILHPLTTAEILENGGKKMKKIGKKRRFIVAHEIAEANHKHSTFGALARRLKKKAGGKRDQGRDWMRVARTEYTTAKASASLDLIRSVFGQDAKVFREPDPECCDKCFELLANKIFKAGEVPADLVGAVHPNCVCPPWQTVAMPDLTKAIDPLADIPIGVVKRVLDGKAYKAEISTGTGYWVPMDSITGRSIMRVCLINIPAIMIGKKNGFTVFAHGKFSTREAHSLYDLSQMGSARFYPSSMVGLTPEETREQGMSKIHDLHQYTHKMLAVLPTVATMPEYWDKGQTWRYVSDFMGFKTLTDWLIIIPGEPPLKALLDRIKPSQTSQRRAVRAHTQAAVERNTMKKAP